MRMHKLIVGGAVGLVLFGTVSPTMAMPFTANGSAVNEATPKTVMDVKGWGGGGFRGGGFRGGGARFHAGAFRGAHFRSANFRASAFRGVGMGNRAFRVAAINGGKWNGVGKWNNAGKWNGGKWNNGGKWAGNRWNRWHGNNWNGNYWNGNYWGYYGWGVGALALAAVAYSYYDYGRGCYYDAWGQLYCDYPYGYLQ